MAEYTAYYDTRSIEHPMLPVTCTADSTSDALQTFAKWRERRWHDGVDVTALSGIPLRVTDESGQIVFADSRH